MGIFSQVLSCNSLEGFSYIDTLVDRGCINSLKASMLNMNTVQKELVVINPEDVFLSFIANPSACDSGKDLHLVTFSQPKLGLVKAMVEENKDLASMGILEMLKENKAMVIRMLMIYL